MVVERRNGKGDTIIDAAVALDLDLDPTSRIFLARPKDKKE
jgi:hypothetical protein